MASDVELQVLQLVTNENDFDFEKQLFIDETNFKLWIRYLEHKKNSNSQVKDFLLERILKIFPISYKLWKNYLDRKIEESSSLKKNDDAMLIIENTFERCIAYLNKMPRIWLMYTKFLESNGQITKTRKTYDRALKSLPLCQHYKIWPQYIDFINASGVPMLGNSVFRRYIELVPEDSEVFVNYLVKNGFLDEASEILINLLNKQSFSSKYGKSKYELWIELCQIICNSARQNENREFDADKIFRQGIKTYSAQVSLLFNQLANYYIHRDLIPKAQAVYEEALGQVKTVKDFTEIYDVYVQFLESLLTDKLDKISKLHDNAEKERLQIEIEHMMAGLEHLLDSNQLMINEVRLRQDPHSVPLWLNRFGLLKSNNSNKTMLEEQFEKSLNIIDIEKAVGDPSQLFIEMANYYFESHNSLEKVRNIFERGVYSYRFIKVQHLSNLWSYWIEFEIKNQNYDKARELIKKATSYDSFLHKQNLGGEFNARSKIHRDLKLWTLYADFEEHFGTFTSCKAIYDHMLDSRIATMSVICNYAVYFLENQYYEESFRIYERGISLFKWPYSYQLWREYLANFEKYFSKKYPERMRELFENCLAECPLNKSIDFYLNFSDFEIRHGYKRKALAILTKALDRFSDDDEQSQVKSANKSENIEKDAFIVFERLQDITSKHFGVLELRKLYEKAINYFDVAENSLKIALEFAKFEQDLGEIDRSRTILAYSAQIANPEKFPKFWDYWQQFEVQFGNDQTVREMLRIKRSVKVQFEQSVRGFEAGHHSNEGQQSLEDPMNNLELKASNSGDKKILGPDHSKINFVSTSSNQEKIYKNPDEIDISQSQSESASEQEILLEEKVPGFLSALAENTSQNSPRD